MSKKPTNPHASAKADRAAIRASNPIAFLIDAMQGKPAPVRDAAGRIVEWDEPLEYEKRTQIAQGLARKVLADLSAQQIDLNANTEGTIKIILGDGLAPPASLDEPRDVTPAPEQIEHQPSVPAPQAAPDRLQDAPDELKQRVRTRQRKTSS